MSDPAHTADDLVSCSDKSNAEKLLEFYDPASDTWSIPFDGDDFEKSVHEAHAAGLRGQGRTIAVLDTTPDLTMPALRDRVETVMQTQNAPHAHGTAVDLMITRTAPDAKILHFDISGDDGKVFTPRLLKALIHPRLLEADVICLSNGRSRDPGDVTLARPKLKNLSDVYDVDPQNVLARARAIYETRQIPQATVRNCGLIKCLCEYVRHVDSNAIICAAAGNSAAPAFCPALDPRTISVGYKSVRRITVGGTEIAIALHPGFDQADHADYLIQQTTNAERTSFANPLLAGALTLALDAGPFDKWRLAQAIFNTAEPYESQLQLFSSASKQPGLPPDEMAALLRSIYKMAFDTTAMDTPDKMTSAERLCTQLFLGPYLVNAGYFLLGANAYGDAQFYSEWAAQLQKWSRHPHANAGKANFELSKVLYAQEGPSNAVRAQLSRARAYYDQALALDPCNTCYADEHKLICQAQHQIS